MKGKVNEKKYGAVPTNRKKNTYHFQVKMPISLIIPRQIIDITSIILNVVDLQPLDTIWELCAHVRAGLIT